MIRLRIALMGLRPVWCVIDNCIDSLVTYASKSDDRALFKLRGEVRTDCVANMHCYSLGWWLVCFAIRMISGMSLRVLWVRFYVWRRRSCTMGGMLCISFDFAYFDRGGAED